jgi:hypothetical protein
VDWFNIAPVWGVLIEASISFPIAVFGTAWAWRVSRQEGRFSEWWGGLAFGAVFVAGLVIDEAIGLVRGRALYPTIGAGVITELLFAAIPVVPVGILLPASSLGLPRAQRRFQSGGFVVQFEWSQRARRPEAVEPLSPVTSSRRSDGEASPCRDTSSTASPFHFRSRR